MEGEDLAEGGRTCGEGEQAVGVFPIADPWADCKISRNSSECAVRATTGQPLGTEASLNGKEAETQMA